MATKEILVVTCDKCGFEEADQTKFLHVVVSTIVPHDSKEKVKILTARDLCLESCVGAPGVNRER
jgi:hypothetical protein